MEKVIDTLLGRELATVHVVVTTRSGKQFCNAFTFENHADGQADALKTFLELAAVEINRVAAKGVRVGDVIAGKRVVATVREAQAEPDTVFIPTAGT